MSKPAVQCLASAENPAWYCALTLVERLAAGLPDNSSTPVAPLLEEERLRFRWESWKSQAPFEQDSYFAQRLALDHLTEWQLRQLLSESPESLQARFPQAPAWLQDLTSATTQSYFQGFITDQLNSKAASGFLNAALPFIQQSLERFNEGVANLRKTAGPLPFDPSTAQQIFFDDLADNLLKLLSRTLVLELNVARLSGELTGATPEARFQNFIEALRQPERWHALWAEYPVLARLLIEQAQRWVTVSLEFLTRLCQDWAAIKTTFTPAHDPGVLVAVKGGLSDTHQGGRSVLIAKFSSGWRIVYKPKSLAVDAHFQELLQWLNARGAAPHFPTLTVLDRQTYGWVQYVGARACQTRAELERFYQRQGGYLALLSLLEATDFHAGNVIAGGEYPYLIDLEALFHPHRHSTQLNADATADQQAQQALTHSLLRIGLLPERVWGNSAHAGVDQSGLGTADEQLTPHALPQWEEVGTDAMRLVRKRKRMKSDKNRPKLAGMSVNVVDYEQEILAGFAATYDLLLKHKTELAATDGPLARFAQDEVCMFLRSMRTYRRLLRESYHPDVLRDALDRDRLFDLLWVEVPDDPDLAAVIQLERAELWRGDIPAFTARPASRDLWVSATERLPDFFAEASLTVVQRRLEQMSNEDRARQAWVIRASLATLPLTPPTDEAAGLAPVEHTATAAREALFAAAQAIGDHLAHTSLCGPDDASWLGFVEERKGCWEVDVLGLDLEGGLPGVALFLAYLGAVTGQTNYTALAQATLKTMQQQIREWGADIGLIGGFDGWGGVIYTLTHLGVLWQRPELIAEAEALVERLPALIAEDEEFDLHSGAAGCIAALRCLAHYAPTRRVEDTAIQCGDHLLAHLAALPAAGFLHGAAGSAWALRLLHTWTGLERFQAGAETVLREAQTAEGALPENFVDSGFARLCELPGVDAELYPQIVAALAANLESGFGRNHSMRNGVAGCFELLMQAEQRGATPAQEQEPQLRQFAGSWLAAIAQHGWRCGTPRAVETPGLLTGLAGIGWQLLRLAAPERVPSVLYFEPPPMRYRER